MIQDIRFGLRMLMKNPAVTSVAVVTLALGIGANSSVFSLLDALLFRPLAVKDPKQLVFVHVVASNNKTRNEIPYPTFEQFRDRNRSFSGIATYDSAPIGATVGGQPEMVWGDFVSGSYFDVLGVGAAWGRAFTAEDEKTDQSPVAVISYGYWKRRFAEDASVVGKTIHLAKVSVSVIGVMPPGFRGAKIAGRPADIFLPMALRPQLALNDIDRSTIVGPTDRRPILARLKPGVGLEQARADLDLIYQQILAEEMGSGQRINSSGRIELKPGFRGDSELPQDAALGLKMLVAVVAIVLLIASVNIAGLLLARATTRQKEIAVRLAVGASRWRLIRQLLTESSLLAMLGGALGLLLAKWGAGFLGAILLHQMDNPNINFSLDLRVLGFTIAVSLLTGILFGLAPALAATRVDLNPILKGSEGGTKSGTLRLGLGKSFVVVQVVMSLALLMGAGLMIRSLRQLYSVDTGFERDKVLTVMAYHLFTRYDHEKVLNLDRELLERLSALPGVESASLSTSPLYRGAVFIGPRFFETEGIGLVAGREFSTADTKSAAKVAVISEGMARKYFPNENPVGQRFGFEPGGGYRIQPKTGEIEVIGVAKDIRPRLWEQEWLESFYFPYTQAPPTPRALGQVQFLIRTAGTPTSIIPAIRRELQPVEQDLTLASIKTQAEEMNERFLGGAEALATLLGFFSTLALGLAAIGLYGTMSYTVGRRTKEIGIRMALGAQRTEILRMVLGEGLSLVMIGIVIGIPAAIGAGRLISSMLFEVKTTDPVAISIAILVMLTIALAAGCLPARQATKVDPMVALRHE